MTKPKVDTNVLASIAANNALTYQGLLDQFTPSGDRITRAENKDKIWHLLITSAPDGIQLNTSHYQAILQMSADYVLAPEERLLYAAAIMYHPLRSGKEVAAFVHDYLYDDDETAAMVRAATACVTGEQLLPLVSYLVQAGADPDIASKFEQKYPAIAKAPLPHETVMIVGGFNGLNYHYYDMDKLTRHVLTYPTLRKLSALAHQEATPDKILAEYKLALRKSANVRMASDFAEKTSIPIPALATVTADLEDFVDYLADAVTGGEVGDWLTFDELYHTAARFCNEMFTQQGQVPSRWGRIAVYTVLTAKGSWWQGWERPEQRDLHQVLTELIDFLEGEELIANADDLRDAVNDAYKIYATDEFDAGVAELAERVQEYADNERERYTDPLRYLNQRPLLTVLLADGWSLRDIIELFLAARNLSASENNSSAINWLATYVQPAYTMAAAAKETGVSLLLNPEPFWGDVYNAWWNSAEPLTTDKRLRIATQMFVGQGSIVTRSVVHKFAKRYAHILDEEFALSLPELEQIVLPESESLAGRVRAHKVVSMAEARKLMRKERK